MRSLRIMLVSDTDWVGLFCGLSSGEMVNKPRPPCMSQGASARGHGSTSLWEAGFFSSARSFSLEPGPRVDPDQVVGYYIDLRQKADEPRWPPHWAGDEGLYVDFSQWALGAYEHYLEDRTDAWLAAARAAGVWLLGRQARGGPNEGSFSHPQDYPHTYRLNAPWVSGIVQGQCASLFVRLFLTTRDERFAEGALSALRPLAVPTSEGGAVALLGGGPFPEEYPTNPPSYVLNGAIFALFGLYDVSVGLDNAYRSAFDEMVDVLASNLYRWDLGYWSRYDLYPHPVVNVASSAYHHLHISELAMLVLLTQRREFSEAYERFTAYELSFRCRMRAFAGKALFRLFVPRRKPSVTGWAWDVRENVSQASDGIADTADETAPN
jgi:hypothetical protein